MATLTVPLIEFLALRDSSSICAVTVLTCRVELLDRVGFRFTRQQFDLDGAVVERVFELDGCAPTDAKPQDTKAANQTVSNHWRFIAGRRIAAIVGPFRGGCMVQGPPQHEGDPAFARATSW
jgi:hypothetical protein